jgi:hypothetical protein
MAYVASLIPDAHLAAVGNISSMMAQLEFQIDLGIWRIVGAPQQLTACLTAQMISPIPRLKAFIGLVEVMGGAQESIDKLNKFMADIGGLIEKRNRQVHDPRMVKKGTETVARLQITAKPKVHFGFIDEDLGEIQRTSELIKAKVWEFMALRTGILNELTALHEKSPAELLEIVPLRD